MEIKIIDGVACVYTPYNPDFVRKIKCIGGAWWNSDVRCWCIPETAIIAVRKIMSDVYGYSDIEENETISIEVTFNDEVSEYRSDVVLFGKVLAHARHRDSGARIGDDFAYESGGARSGGSAKYWKSIVEEGSVVILSNVNKNLYERSIVDYDVTIKVLEEKIDKKQLLSEKERLLRRIEKIDNMLCKSA